MLLNQNELDFRETIKEVIEEYPHVNNHKKLVDYPEKKTIDININDVKI